MELLANHLVRNFVRDIWINNFEINSFSHLAEKIFLELEKAENFCEVISIIDKVLSDRDFKRSNRKIRKNPKNLNTFGYRLLEKELKSAKSYLDYGCGRMALIRRILRESLNNIERVYGFEPKADMRYFGLEGKAELIRENEEVKNLTGIDLISINYVLHHLTEEEINGTLQICKNILSPNGKIIVLEESYSGEEAAGTGSNLELNSFRQPLDFNITQKFLTDLGFNINIPLSLEFESLHLAIKKQIIILNDILLNYKNLSYMPWTMEYHSIDRWIRIFEGHGLRIKDLRHLGFVEGAKAKGGTTTLFTLQKS